jgi:hypothetical protein
MSIAGAPGGDNARTSTEALQRVRDVTFRSLQGNFLSVLLASAAFVRITFHLGVYHNYIYIA